VTPRLKHLDPALVFDRLADFIDSKLKTRRLIESEPGRLEQTRYVSLAATCESIGLYRYALGFNLELVIEDLLEAAKAYLSVFQLRGTEVPFPVTVLTLDVDKSSGDTRVIAETPLHPSGAQDFSVTNSKKGLIAMFLALVAHDQHLASALSCLVWDPPDATYIGPRSEVCTPSEQHFAYSVRHLLEHNSESAMIEIRRLRIAKKVGWLAGTRKMTEGIVAGDCPHFREGLDEHLSWHRREAEKPKNYWRNELYLSLCGLGMAKIALANKVARVEDLPTGDVYFPLELLQY
jgi:hypothetical protein